MNRAFMISFTKLFCPLLLCFCLSGCGEMKVAPVSGTVTLDGAPLNRASVMFLPKAGGRPSSGVTNEQGRYTLGYSPEEAGAEVGICKVQVTTRAAADDAGNPASKEKVPAKYFKDSPIEVKVEAKSNTIDIELTSK